jgi:voltage-gated potassium channel
MELRQSVRFYLDDLDTRIGKGIAIALSGMVVLSAVIFVAETYPLSPDLRSLLHVIDEWILVFFVVEYLLRLWSAEKPLKYAFSLYGLIDLLVILPLLITALDIRFIRIFRWFRILRLVRWVEGQLFLGYVSREDAVIFARILFTLFTIVFIYSGLIYQVEHPVNSQQFQTFLDAAYFAIATMTTVGFGDITPISELGRLLTVLMILTGIALIPLQVGDLVKQILKTSNRLETRCESCGWASHESDAKFCKRCGGKL